MKKLFIVFIFLITSFDFAYSAGKSKSTLDVKSRDGTNIVYGSILKANQNNLKTKLPPKAVKSIRETGLDNLSVSITRIAQENETSTVCAIPSENLDLFGRNLSLDVLPCTNTAGATVTAGALEEGTYRLTISSGSETFTGTFLYKAPAVTVGTVSSTDGSCTGGTHRINSLSGDPLGTTVALSNNCSYFNEVQAARVSDIKKATKKPKKGKGKKTRNFLNQESGDSGSSDITGPEDGEIGFYVDENGFSSDTAISEAVITTDNGNVEEKSGVVELDPGKNGDVQFDLNDETTMIVEEAINFIGGDEEDFNNEKLELLEDSLKNEVDFTLLCNENEAECKTISEGKGGEPLDFQKCNIDLNLELAMSVPENPSKDNLLELGNKIIGFLEDPNNSLRFCFPKFVLEKFLPFIKDRGNEGIIEFAFGFLDNVGGQQRGPEPKELCLGIKEGFKFLKDCNRKFCPKPCFPDEVRSILKENCPEILSLVPEDECEFGPVACETKPPPGFPSGTPGGFGPPGEFGPFDIGEGPGPSFIRATNLKEQFFGPPSGEGEIPQVQCIEIGRPEEPSICKPCETDADCFGPDGREITAKNGATCNLPIVICKSIDVGGTTKKVCLFSETPKDPFTCKELPLPPDAAICGDLRPPIVCGISENGLEQGFNAQCCLAFGGSPKGPFGPPGRFQTTPPIEGDFVDCFENPKDPKCQKIGGGGGKPKFPLEFCVLNQLCINPKENFDDPEFGSPKQDVVQTIIEKCKSDSFQPGGGKPDQSVCDPQKDPNCKSPGDLTSPECGDPLFAKNNPGKCQPFSDNNFQPPPGDFQPPPECLDLEFVKANPDKCLPTPQPGGGGFQPPCDPLKDPNCKPPDGGFGGFPCDPQKDPNCKPPPPPPPPPT